MTEYKCRECTKPCEVVVLGGKMDYLDLCVVSGELETAKFIVVR